jgi:sulfite exporter TauE/SafE
MANYDPAILQAFANKLYARANGIIGGYTLAGIIVGGVGGWVFDRSFQTGNSEWIIAGSALLIGLFGFTLGSGRAFLLKFQAQQALCQRQIEMNTRAAAESHPS